MQQQFPNQQVFQPPQQGGGFQQIGTLIPSLCSEDEARSIAQLLWDTYSLNGQMTVDSVRNMMVYIYKCTGREYQPNSQDVQEYEKILDTTGKNFVNLGDLQKVCVKWLVGQMSN